MIARTASTEKPSIWTDLAAPLPADAIQWRQDGKPTTRDGKFFARFVAYVDAHFVRERLDSIVPGEWDLSLELLPPTPGGEAAGACCFKARLQILGVIREDVGTAEDYKAAATDAFKRAAVRFGIAHELYAYEQNWVQVDGDGRFAKPLEDPQAAYERRHGKGGGHGASNGNGRASNAAQSAPSRVADTVDATEEEIMGTSPTQANADNPDCPKCGGRMWDNRATKRNPRQPDYKCRDRSCDGVIWPPKGQGNGNGRRRASEREEISMGEMPDLDTSPLGGGVDDIPF